MSKNGLSRKFALGVGGLAIAAMGLTVGCSKQSPAPTAPVQNTVESKVSAVTRAPASAKPPVKATPAPPRGGASDAKPGDPGWGD